MSCIIAVPCPRHSAVSVPAANWIVSEDPLRYVPCSTSAGFLNIVIEAPESRIGAGSLDLAVFPECFEPFNMPTEAFLDSRI